VGATFDKFKKSFDSEDNKLHSNFFFNLKKKKLFLKKKIYRAAMSNFLKEPD